MRVNRKLTNKLINRLWQSLLRRYGRLVNHYDWASATDINGVKPYVDATTTGFTINFITITVDNAQQTFKFNYFNAQ